MGHLGGREVVSVALMTPVPRSTPPVNSSIPAPLARVSEWEERPWKGYFFLEACWLAMAWFFFCVATLAFTCFCEAFF